jgi:hypothetical protein
MNEGREKERKNNKRKTKKGRKIKMLLGSF